MIRDLWTWHAVGASSSSGEVREDPIPMELDPDDPQDAIFVLAAIDEDDRAAGGPGITGAPGYPGVDRAGCGCMGCLLPMLVIVAAAAAGFGALPLAAVLGLAAVLLALMDRGRGDGHA